jgi:ABC-2 type transport system ATP-binding protein
MVSVPAIEINNLTVKFRKLVAVDALSLTVEPGKIFGFIGPNGAGKTTTMRVLATLLPRFGGDVRVFGFHPVKHAREVRKRIGFMPDDSGVYKDMTVIEYLEFFSAAFDIPRPQRVRVIADVLELTDLGDKRWSLSGALSRGMTQRLGLARVLLHDPDLLILDEPASGLDPRARIELQEILRSLGELGKTILISSHILSELGRLCDSIGIIEKGHLIYAGSVQDALNLADGRNCLKIRVKQEQQRALDMLLTLPGVLGALAVDGSIEVSLEEGIEDYSHLSKKLIEEGFELQFFAENTVQLEDAFMALTRGEVQ